MNSNKKKSILIIPYTYSMGGGAERVLREILENIDIRKYNIDIQEIEQGNKKNEPYISRENGITWLKPLWKSKTGFMSVLIKLKQLIFTILPILFRNTLPKKEYDIAIAFNYQIPSFACCLCNSSKKVTWIHSSIEDIDFRRYYGIRRVVKWIKFKTQKRALEKMDTIVAISDMTKVSIIKLFPHVADKIKIIRNGSNLKLIKAKSNEFKIEESKDKFRLISCGRLDENKNVSFLLYVMQSLLETEDVELFVLGDGPERDSLEKLSKELGIESKVKFFGFCPNPYPYIASSNLLCLSSYIEGSPVIVAEALTLGIPFISCLVGGIHEFSNNEKTGIISERDINDYKRNIVSLIHDKDKYFSLRNNSLKLISKYDISKQIEKIEHFLDE